MTKKKFVYLDYHASTPCDPEVVTAMLPYFSKDFANPASGIHLLGRAAADAVSESRATVAEVLGARPREIVFTSGATESNNLAILGVARRSKPSRNHIVTCATEHKSVLAPCEALRKDGFDVSILPVGSDGRVSLAGLDATITNRTLLVTIQAANNEIGTLQPLAEISRLSHDRGALFHCDAAQAVGKIPFDVGALEIDLLSASAHKLYGPKGVGCLFVRGGARNLPIAPLAYGGGQEEGLRPGTTNVPAIVGFAIATKLAAKNLPASAERIGKLRDSCEKRLLAELPKTRRNGCLDARLPGNLSLTFPGVDAEALLASLPEIAISMGSACTHGAPDPSHVLLAIGLSRSDALSTIRICIGKDTSLKDLEFVSTRIVEEVRRIRQLTAV